MGLRNRRAGVTGRWWNGRAALLGSPRVALGGTDA
jgi:hypothetical protein